MMYEIRDREAGNVIDVFDKLEDAKKEVEKYEQMDKEDGNFSNNFYEIKEIEGNFGE